MKAILLNGPPRCGKDFAAHAIKTQLQWFSVLLDRFSIPNKRAFAGMMKLSISSDGIVDIWEERKDAPIPCLGVSYRQWQIDYSEKFMKPLYGQDVFVRLLIDRISHRLDCDDYVVVLPDCGFQIEVDRLVEKLGRDNCLLLQIHRQGYDFTGDSRSYVSRRDEGPFAMIFNYGDKSYATTIMEATQEFLCRPAGSSL